jgi:hypothetical protein
MKDYILMSLTMNSEYKAQIEQWRGQGYEVSELENLLK